MICKQIQQLLPKWQNAFDADINVQPSFDRFFLNTSKSILCIQNNESYHLQIYNLPQEIFHHQAQYPSALFPVAIKILTLSVSLTLKETPLNLFVWRFSVQR